VYYISIRCMHHTTDVSVRGGTLASQEPKYKTIRLKEEDYNKLKEVQTYLRKKGTDTLNWEELKRQNIVEVPDEEDKESGGELTMGVLLGLGAAALAYLLWKNSQNK